MKTYRFTCAALTATLILGMTACTNNSNEPDNWKVGDDPITTTLQVSIAGADTRVSMDEDVNTGAIDCKWETGDKFKLIHSFELGTATAGIEQIYTLAKGANEKVGTFTTTDKAPTGDGLFYAFYPETSNYFNGGDLKKFAFFTKSSDYTTQRKDAPLAHLKPYHCLGATGTYTNGRLGAINFVSMMSIISFNISTSDNRPITPNSVTFNTTTTEYLNTTNSIRFDDNGNMTVQTGASTDFGFIVNLSDYDKVTNFTANYILPYQDMSAYTFTIEVETATGTYVSDPFNGINLVGGKRYTKSVTVTKQ